MKSILVVSFLSILLSCNVVKWKDKNSTKKLARKEIASQYFDEDSLHIKYWKGGSGPIIVFIHGFGGDALLSWEKEMETLSKNHTVIAMDILWFGDSKSNKPAVLSTQTEALEKLLKKLNITKASFIGQSYGGFILVDFALRHPEMVERMIVANSPGTTFDIKELEEICNNYKVRNIAEMFVFSEPEKIQRLINLSSYKKPHLPKFALKQSYDIHFAKNQKEKINMLQSLPAEQERMRDITSLQKIETLILWGELDEIFSLKSGQTFANAINAKFIYITKCGHAPQIDDHDRFLRILKEFFNAL
jgi:pimeloyl-ACP methyl ester carboxylesterase